MQKLITAVRINAYTLRDAGNLHIPYTSDDIETREDARAMLGFSR